MTLTTESLEQQREYYRQRVESRLRQSLAGPGSGDEALQELYRAMRYSAVEGGKHLRALLVYFAARIAAQPETLSPTQEQICDHAAAAVEMVHSYSLIHDDLPAMDDDDWRRGKASNHKVFGEAMAILAGDGLQSAAFGLLAGSFPEVAATTRVQLIAELARGCGADGMVGGQAIDIRAPKESQGIGQLQDMHLRKTGALMIAAARMGGYCANASPQTLLALTDYAQALGLAFQIRDDILDATGSSAELGKTPGKDALIGKPTFVTAYGVDGARVLMSEQVELARCALKAHGAAAEPLLQLLDLAVHRSH